MVQVDGDVGELHDTARLKHAGRARAEDLRARGVEGARDHQAGPVARRRHHHRRALLPFDLERAIDGDGVVGAAERDHAALLYRQRLSFRDVQPAFFDGDVAARVAFDVAAEAGGVCVAGASDGEGRNSPFTAKLKASMATTGQSITDLMMVVSAGAVRNSAAKGRMACATRSLTSGLSISVALVSRMLRTCLPRPSSRPSGSLRPLS